MNVTLQIILIVATLLFCVFILAVTRKKKLSYKYTLLWLCFGLITLLCAIFPSIIKGIAGLIHIAEPTNALFLVYIFLMIVIIFYISLAFSKLHEKVTTLVQENAILARRVEKLEKQIGENQEKDD